jgi:tetratricopeptide (TPR) repeat protein
MQGVHDYVVGSLPLLYKMLGFLAGFRGDRDRGIRTLEQVAKHGQRNRVDAEIILCALYRREGLPRQALPLLEDLLERFPRNYLFRFEQAQMHSALGEKEQALAALERVAALKRRRAAGYARVPWDKIWFQQGTIQFWYNDLDEALENMQKVTANADELDLNTGVLAWMRVGQIYDLTGRRNFALEAYTQAISYAPRSEAARECRRYLSKPYQRPKRSE